MSAPLVSVIIPCYRQGRYLAQAIDSALAQTHPAVEVLVVNDGSDDNTEEVARGYGERIRYIARPNGGLSAARNTGIAQAQGVYLKFLDSDDHLHPEQIAWQVEALAGHTDRLALTGIRFYRDGVPEQFEDHTPTPCSLFPYLFEDDDWLPPIAYLVPTALARDVGGFNEALRLYEDWDFFSRIALQGRVLVSAARIGAFYRLHAGSLSTRRLEMMTTRARLLIERHQALRGSGRPDWFGLALLKAEQGSYHNLVLHGVRDEKLLGHLLDCIRELQRREGFGQFGWRFRLLARLIGYARAEHVRARVVKALRKRPRESLDTGAWREAT